MVLFYGNICAWISMDGQALDVYGVEISRNMMTCWIASESGKKFSVNWSNLSRAFPLQGTVYIDGIACDTHIMLDAYSFPNVPSAIGVCYARTSEYTRRDFMFAPIEVTDDDAYLDTIARAGSFGTIKLELWRLHVISVASKLQEHQPGNPVLESQVVHERSKKAGTHHVKYSEEYYSPPSVVDVVTGNILGTTPYATFEFRYRPMSMLMANDIVPRPATQLDQSTLAEIRALEVKLENLRAKAGQSANSLLLHSGRRIKTQSGVNKRSIRRNSVKGSPLEVIDLTND